MGKHGPCCHCGVTSTPLWRNGPTDKPVLCNACGSRWRTKGTLAHYAPLHARAEANHIEDHRVKTTLVKNKETKALKHNNDNDLTDYNRKVLDEDTTNRSSSGSAISNQESCAQYGSGDASDLTGPSQQSIVWDSTVPLRKRTCFNHPKPSPVEKLTNDLYTIWHEQQASCFSVSSEDELLLESDKPMVSVEIGHGSVLIRHPDSILREEESEASSLSFDNKAFSTGVDLSSSGVDKMKKPANWVMEQEGIRRDKNQLEKLQILAHHNSPLCYVDLQDVLNCDSFASYLTNDEQQKLLKLLPSADISKAPESSLRNMFDSPQFGENVLSFQKLLADGLFDNTLSGLKTEDSRTLKRLVLCNMTKSNWVGKYKIFEDSKDKNSVSESQVAGEFKALATDYSVCLKGSRDGPDQNVSGTMTTMKIPRRITKTSSYDEIDNKDWSLLSQKSHISNGSQVIDDEQELLVNVPCNGSFPQAELLFPMSTSSSSIYSNFIRH